MARRTTRILAIVFAILAAILNFISFVSPYWLESEERARNYLQRIGLWEACLKDFVDPKDYVSKLYNGCWWIFWPEFQEIRYWLNPAWFTALQTFATFNFLAVIIGAIAILSGSKKVGLILIFISFLLSGLDSILFGLGSIDRTWMPKSDYNFLSWGYWLHVTGGFFAFISAVALFSNMINEKRDEKMNDRY